MDVEESIPVEYNESSQIQAFQYDFSNNTQRGFNQSLQNNNAQNNVMIQQQAEIASFQQQGTQNEHIQNLTSQTGEEQIAQELDFTEYKKNFLPIFLQGYELYLKKKKQPFVNNSDRLYAKVDNLFKQLQIEGNDRKKYGIKLIKLIQNCRDFNFISTVNDYRRTYAPLFFMKKVPSDPQGKEKLILYIKTLKEPFPSEKLKTHIQNKPIKKKKLNNKLKPTIDKNIYRKLMREARRIINKQDQNFYKQNLKGLYDFYDSFKAQFIDKKDQLISIIKQVQNSELNEQQEKKIRQFFNYVNSENNQQNK